MEATEIKIFKQNYGLGTTIKSIVKTNNLFKGKLETLKLSDNSLLDEFFHFAPVFLEHYLIGSCI